MRNMISYIQKYFENYVHNVYTMSELRKRFNILWQLRFSPSQMYVICHNNQVSIWLSFSGTNNYMINILSTGPGKCNHEKRF
jgi:hypothetical protein